MLPPILIVAKESSQSLQDKHAEAASQHCAFLLFIMFCLDPGEKKNPNQNSTQTGEMSISPGPAALPFPRRSRPVSTGCSGKTSNAILVFNTLKRYLGPSPGPCSPPSLPPPPNTDKCLSMQNPDPILPRIRAQPASPCAGEPSQTLCSKSSPSNPQGVSEGSRGREGGLLWSVSVLPAARRRGIRSCQRCAAAELK